MPDQPIIITTTTGKLATILGSTLPFTAGEWDHPGLNGVQIHAAAGVITATATNRYVLGHARKAASGELPRGIFLGKPAAHLVRKTISLVMKQRTSGDDIATMAVTFHGDEPALVVFDFCDITIRLVEGQPAKYLADIDGLLAKIPAPGRAELTAPIVIAPHLTQPLIEAAKWANAGPANGQLRWSFVGPNEPARVEIEDWFVAAVMPVKTLKAPSVPAVAPRPAADLQPAGQG